MNARDKILGRIRNAQARQRTPAQVETISSHLAQHPRGPLPPSPDDLVASFRERAIKLSSDVLEAKERMEVPALLARYLDESKLPMRGVCWPSLAELPWNAAGLEMQSRPATNQDLVGVTGAFCAIAETGTLMHALGSGNTRNHQSAP